jgi:hypothetical protein
MMQDILDIDELFSNQRKLSRKLTELQCTLPNFAAEGAEITAHGINKARDEFLNIQCQQLIRTLQVEE